jgi:hypothetical protein
MKRWLALKLVEMTLPDKPRSKNQQYRLTQKGKQMIRSLKPKTLNEAVARWSRKAAEPALEAWN